MVWGVEESSGGRLAATRLQELWGKMGTPDLTLSLSETLWFESDTP